MNRINFDQIATVDLTGVTHILAVLRGGLANDGVLIWESRRSSTFHGFSSAMDDVLMSTLLVEVEATDDPRSIRDIEDALKSKETLRGKDRYGFKTSR
ncbi:hypothetical protein [Pseudomonas panipatensis]|uniref:Uncharacterized protein n=1 Tax=Pseudomonas panipatensis TaxID=428992 RepID=A0A1G8BH73_9PSED|nr:hypothetical protein [Pseudomonas panipatensis]SDH32414.1 hypothetical protein SAMN05216272_10157 [Pseudomonas panipatensis]SMP71097.1 hypothetical protein SAMN06295951_11037 [Pseudomonas panipatensis]